MGSPQSLGPLGRLTGFTFDPLRGRYFPISGNPSQPRQKATSASSSTSYESESESCSALSTPTGYDGPYDAYRRQRSFEGKKKAKDKKNWVNFEAVPRPKRISRAFRSRSNDDAIRGEKQNLWSRVSNLEEVWYTGYGDDSITSIKSYPNGGLYLTTDSGRVTLYRPGCHSPKIHICSRRLLGMHVDFTHMLYTAISNGREPHVHIFRLNASENEYTNYQLGLPPCDIFAMSGYADACTLASSRSLVSIHAEKLAIDQRRLRSDPLCLHHASRDVVIAGLRSGDIVTQDLRTKQNNPPMANLRKAIVGVKRLADHAVPFGVLASALENQLAIFDIRFSSYPLKTFKSHVNTYHTSLALETSPDDMFVFAAGSDQRIRCYSTITAEEILPIVENSPLNEVFNNEIKVMDVSQSTLRVASKGRLITYGADSEVDSIWAETTILKQGPFERPRSRVGRGAD